MDRGAAESARMAWPFPWRAWRDRLLANPGFRRWAANFPLTRPIARRRARALFDLCAGFVYSQVLYACVRLGVFEALSDGPLTLSELVKRLSLSSEATERLMQAASALDLVELRGKDIYGLGSLGATVVNHEAITAMIKHHADFYADLADPVALLRAGPGSTRLGRYWPYVGTREPASLGDHQVAAYSGLMSSSQSLIAEEVLAVHSMQGHRVLLDVGGGEGAFVAAVARRWPHLQLVLFDLPAVAERAHGSLGNKGLLGQIQLRGGDFFRDELPDGADIVTLVRVLHDHDDDAALVLLRAAHKALQPGGTLLIAEPIADTSGARAMGAAYFGFYLWAMGSGKSRKYNEINYLLKSTGYERISIKSTHQPLQTSLIVARKPE